MSAPPTALDAARRRAADPAPSSIERGPVARLHWRSGIASDPAFAALATDGSLSPEWAAVLAETAARLGDPAGVRDLPAPSPVGAAVGRALVADPSWPTLCDAAACHPAVARETVIALAPVVRAALVRADVAKRDTRRALGDLAALRAALDAARARQHAAREALDVIGQGDDRDDAVDEHAAAMAASVDAAGAVEVAEAACAANAGAGERVATDLATRGAAVLAGIAATAEKAVAAVRAMQIAGLGEAMGADDVASVPDDVVALLTPEVAALLRTVGALRLSLREGRASRHLPGREGMLGPDVGGLDRVGDLLPLARAALAGHLGPGMAALERLRLVQGRAAVAEKGGGKANKGDVVIVVDKSGSMQGAREQWASALALAVVLEARAENRVCAVVTYDGAVRASVIVDGPVGMREAFAAICKVSGGDNNERAALRAAGACLSRMRRGGDAADVLMITDGQWQSSNLDGAGIDHARLRAVFIGGSCPPGAVFASSWSVDDSAVEGADGLPAAVKIARTIV